MLDLYELHVFLVAAETQNFSETARILQISQPAVSGHIHSLEEQLKTQLFESVSYHQRKIQFGPHNDYSGTLVGAVLLIPQSALPNRVN